MIPESEMSSDLEFAEDSEVTKTYKVLPDKTQGYVDDIEALQQAIYKVLNTEKYEYPIYSFNYGIELENLIGKDIIYVKIEMKRRIQECLLQDERINSVENFQFNITGDEILCTFDVSSIYGDLTITKEVIT